ncbi:MAG TPA: DUF5700 domain-containing putative Zn-dependent protease [Pyrinomonadaceae bacterium]|jgi:hypothetical protein
MNKAIFFIFTIAFILIAANNFPGQTVPSSRLDLRIVADEAEAVLRILQKRENSAEITEADWQKVFSSEGYTRLKKRESAMSRPFADEDFKAFVLSPELFARRRELAATLRAWKEIDAARAGAAALQYLPANAAIRARVYPVIKPRDNSFVFEVRENPAIFLFLDPKVTKRQFENTLAHELHHIGFGTACPPPETSAAIEKLPPARQKVLKWTGAFGEGFAMLAAAGGAGVHPHAVSAAEDRARWDRDAANFNDDLKTVEKFLLDLEAGKLTEEKEVETARSFYGETQGAWYTVGWQMAAVIEKTYGRARLIEVFCDRRKLLPTFNEAVKKYNRRHKTRLAEWSPELIAKFE